MMPATNDTINFPFLFPNKIDCFSKNLHLSIEFNEEDLTELSSVLEIGFNFYDKSRSCNVTVEDQSISVLTLSLSENTSLQLEVSTEFIKHQILYANIMKINKPKSMPDSILIHCEITA